ncbi:MAG TPA: autotransporter-associated beta strand repeat-containing protein [Rariglobus sp.]|jgi:autotransporter-associated beta strand protein|nr:autotransporter-associated beta strand repeat-containing protein [Rariglobus sp.]
MTTPIVASTECRFLDPRFSRFGRIFKTACAGFSGMITAGVLSAAALTWDANPEMAGAQDGDGVWSVTTNNWWNGEANVALTTPLDIVTIGAGKAAKGVVTLSGTQTVAEVKFHVADGGSYTLSGGKLVLAGISPAVTVDAGGEVVVGSMLVPLSAFKTTIGQGAKLALSGGQFTTNVAWTVLGGGLLELNGGVFGGKGGNITLWTQGDVLQRAATLDLKGGRLLIGYGGDSVYTIDDPAAIIVQAASSSLSANLNIVGRSGKSGTLRLKNGTVTLTTPVLIGGDGSSRGVVSIEGGTLSDPDCPLYINHDAVFPAGSGELSISGGVLRIGGIQLGAGGNFKPGASAKLKMTGGALYVGAAGISKKAAGDLSTNILLAGGTIGALENWTSPLDMTLAEGGNVIFTAANEGGESRLINLNGVLSGAGGLTKSGVGVLVLNGANTYRGDTMITAGTLALGAGGSLASQMIVVRSGSVLDVSGVTGGCTLGAAQSLRGVGRVKGALTVGQGATLVGALDDTTTGVLSFMDSLTLGGTTHLKLMNCLANGHDRIVVEGALTLGGTLVLNVGADMISALGGGAATFDLFSATGFSGQFSSISLTGADEAVSHDQNSVTGRSGYTYAVDVKTGNLLVSRKSQAVTETPVEAKKTIEVADEQSAEEARAAAAELRKATSFWRRGDR